MVLEFIKDRAVDIALLQEVWANQSHKVIQGTIKDFEHEYNFDKRRKHTRYENWETP